MKTIEITKEFLIADEDYDDNQYSELMNLADEIIPMFLNSDFCSKWGKNRMDLACYFIQSFIDLSYSYHLSKPFQWDTDLVEGICLDLFPRKLSTNAMDFKHVSPILTAFFKWAQQEGIINESETLCAKLNEIEKDIYIAATDPSKWGMAKSMLN